MVKNSRDPDFQILKEYEILSTVLEKAHDSETSNSYEDERPTQSRLCSEESLITLETEMSW